MSEQAPLLTHSEIIQVLSSTSTATAIHIGESATIQFANDAMLAIWGKDRSVIGKSLSEALPELANQPFAEMMAKVFREGIVISGTDTAAELEVNGVLAVYYFDFEYRAIKNEEGKVLCVLHTAMDVTKRFLNQVELEEAELNREALMREQALNEELASANEELSAINEELSRSREELAQMNSELEFLVEERVKAFTESEERFRTMAEAMDVMIAVSDENGHPIYFNKAWSRLTGRELPKLLAIGWSDLLKEEDRDEYISIHHAALIDRVSYSDEFRVLSADGTYHWLLKKGAPRFLSDGSFAGYVSSCVDISDRKLTEQQLQEVNEELATSNEELSALNNELGAFNYQLLLSEQRFKNIVLQAPFSICVIRAEDLMITDVNDGYLELVGKTREQLENQTIWDAVSEAAESYAPVMQNVINTGLPFIGKEIEIELIRNGIPEILFVDFVYEPVISVSGYVSSIMVVATDVTDKVKARRSIEDVEERIRLAIEAAEIGTFDYNYVTDELVTSDRFNEIFALKDIDYREGILSRYHPSDSHLSNEAHQAAASTGKIFFEARLVYDDQSIGWIRVQGNVYFDKEGARARALGTVLDITEYKRLQLQKDDFISIASHELKTPITSLKASLQLLERMKASPTPMFPKLIDQCSRSMQKVSELVEDLLNVSRMNEGQIMLSKKKFNVSKLLEDCCAHVRQEGKYELVIQGDRSLEVIADDHRIEQVLVNFVNNAVKYAAGSKEIYLSVEKVGEKAKVSVRDTGPGIAPEKVPHLFDRYFRADETGMQVSGLGLGLYISAEIIKRHGGEIGVESEFGKGSTFWFSLPL